MAPMIPAILRTPWPKQPGRTYMPRKADPALRKKAETENQRARVEYDSECSALRKEKLAACPQLALRLSDASTVSLSDGTLDFTVTLGYTTSSKSTPGQPIVLKLFGPKAEGPLSENAIYWGQYQIFLSSENIGEHRVPFEFHNMSLRRPRDANGRFLEMSDNAFTYVVSRAEGWIELSPGQEVSRRVTLRLDQDAAWQRVIRAGRDYWLRWAPSGTVGNPKELDKWKYGGLQDWEGVICDKRKDEFWIPIPVQAEEHGLRFKVVEGLN